MLGDVHHIRSQPCDGLAVERNHEEGSWAGLEDLDGVSDATYRLALPLPPPAACSSTNPRASARPAIPSRPSQSAVTLE